MKRALTIGLLAVAACRSETPARPLTRALLADAPGALEALAPIVARTTRALEGTERVPETLARVVFEELGFQREVDDTDLRFTHLASVLESRRGGCVGLGALYLALGEWLGPRFGFRVEGVLVPGHFFVRVTDRSGTRNVELLRRGESLPDDWYRRRYQVPTGAPAYLRPLSPAEVLAVVGFNVGNELRRRGRLGEARAAYFRAGSDFPQLAEAHASLGLVLHLLGDLPGAERAYRTAAVQNPTLPGLEQNLAQLNAERRSP